MLTFPETLLDKPEEHSVRVIALALLADAVNERERHRTTPDKESLHDFRVALRRLRSWLRAQRPVLAGCVTPKLEKSLRKIAQSTNSNRDAEVFVEWLDSIAEALPTDTAPAAEWLRAEATGAHQSTGIDKPKMDARFTRVAARLGELLPLYSLSYDVEAGATGQPFGTGMSVVIRQHAKMLNRRMSRLTDGSYADQVHRARIAGKRLRYLLEPIVPWIPRGEDLIIRLKALQDTLGALHDAHMWTERLSMALHTLETDGVADEVDPLEHEEGDSQEEAQTTDLRGGVALIVAMVHDHAGTAFDAYRTMWEGEPAAEFFRDVEEVAESLATRQPRELEIERKYLLSGLPAPRPDGEVLFIEQGYLPGDRLIERLRKVTSKNGVAWFRTVKVGTGIARMELDEPTTCEVFDAMWPLTEGRRVAKRRHEIRDGDVTWQIDEFTDRELVLAEVELALAELAPVAPAWLASVFVREVTNESAYVNAQLAK